MYYGYTTTQKIILKSSSKYWKFPNNSLIQYDKSDESWCRYFELGEEVKKDDIYEIQGILDNIKIEKDGLAYYTFIGR